MSKPIYDTKILKEKGYELVAYTFKQFGNCFWCHTGILEAPKTETWEDPITKSKVEIKFNPLWGECTSCGGS